MAHDNFRPGDPVIFRKTKRSERPGSRAKNVHPATKGEQYVYEVDKFWVVAEVHDDRLVLMTRRGKRHVVDRQNRALRRPSLIQRWMYRDRFPTLNECLAAADSAQAAPSEPRQPLAK